MTRTKYKIVRIREETYNKIVKDGVYGETFDTILDRILDKKEKSN